MARKFRFRLETVRQIRERERDAHRRIVSGKVQAIEGIRDRAETLVSGMQQNRAATRVARRDGQVSINLLRGQAFYQAWLARTSEATQEDLEQGLSELRDEHGKLAESSKRLKVIEKLRQRQWAQHKADVDREETMANDEASQQLYWRARHGASE